MVPSLLHPSKSQTQQQTITNTRQVQNTFSHHETDVEKQIRRWQKRQSQKSQRYQQSHARAAMVLVPQLRLLAEQLRRDRWLTQARRVGVDAVVVVVGSARE